MSKKAEGLKEQIERCVLGDYFTPNIRTEVILDTLLTPYIAEIVEGQMGAVTGKLTLLTKEMSILESGSTDDRGTKIDYVLEDGKGRVYLVGLKTTRGSVNNNQISRYIANCLGKSFGEAIGHNLLQSLGKRYPQPVEGKRFLSAAPWLENPAESFKAVVGGYDGEKSSEKARSYLKITKRAATDKYLYTMGQLLDHYPAGLDKLWGSDLRLIYLTPDGGNVFPSKPEKKAARRQAEKEREWEDLRQKWSGLYLGPDGMETSVSLAASAEQLAKKQGDELAHLLADIIKEIYGD